MILRQAPLAGFDEWDAGDYLQQYYSRVEADEAATLDFGDRFFHRDFCVFRKEDQCMTPA